ncbi:capping protein-inhibiting regulator of actin dynamics [Rhinophrynus dorsalis]
MGTRAFSHDSIFIPDGQAEDEKEFQAITQDYIVGNVRTLQQQLAGNIRFGQPPVSISGKRMQDLDASTGEMEGTRSSPVEIIGGGGMEQLQSNEMPTGSPNACGTRTAPETEHKVEEKVTPVKTSRSKRPLASGTIESINLDAVPLSVNRLDNSFAKYKLSVKPKNQRVSKKHRGTSQDYQSTEDAEFENERASNVKKAPDKATQLSTEMSGPNMNISDQPTWKRAQEQTFGKVQASMHSNEIEEIKKLSQVDEKMKKLGGEKEQEPSPKMQEPAPLKLGEESSHLEELEKRLKLEAQKREEEEERKRQEILKSQELERLKQKLEEQKQIELKEQQRREEESRKRAEQIRLELEEQRRQEEQRQREMEEQKAIQEAEEQRKEEERQKQIELRLIEEQKQQELELLVKQKETEDIKKQREEACLATDKILINKDISEKQTVIEEKNRNEEDLKQRQQKSIEAQQQERISEELRWQELDQRQRPFTFKVTSSEKQILFQKVNLSPVTLAKDPVISPDTQAPRDNKPNISPHALPSSMCVPHTAILVTGAQLCGTAVNLNQIKDTACKSLLGLTEEKKHVDNDMIINEKEKHDSKQIISKTKYSSESLDNQSFLAEWASIRSKILSKAEKASTLDREKKGPRVQSDDWTAKGKGDSHSNLRKTMSASAKFSITPAWQKFADSAKSQEIDCETLIKQSVKESKAAVNPVMSDSVSPDKSPERTTNVQEIVTNRHKKQVTLGDSTEGFIFSKDLPSFLVPHPPQSPRRANVESHTAMETSMSNGTRKNDKVLQNGDEKTSPFGIKLRRTNYSLRFHSDPQNDQKRKKRYSAGDSFDGVPAPFIVGDETESGSAGRKDVSVSPAKVKRETITTASMDSSTNLIDNFVINPLFPASSPYLSSPNKDRIMPKSPTIHKPSLAPKPSSPTPPSSPQSRLEKTSLNDLPEQRLDKGEQDKETSGEFMKVNVALSSPSHNKYEEQETKDKKCTFPSIPWREKPEKRPEQSGKERPVLQSRHSLDGSRLAEKVETAQPLWITLALQKQKGFREQQATREERRHAREAKLSERVNRESAGDGVQPREYRSRSGSLQKPAAQEEKKCETVVTRLRREQLQKSNTLPTSVTVEIADASQVPPLAKDIPKRFSTPDASPVSSEPAWLALAKRKSKAWSDCPQIIK